MLPDEKTTEQVIEENFDYHHQSSKAHWLPTEEIEEHCDGAVRAAESMETLEQLSPHHSSSCETKNTNP